MEAVTASLTDQTFELAKFIQTIESTPTLRADVSQCKTSEELVSLANKYSIQFTAGFLNNMRKDLGAQYWPWSQSLNQG